MGKSGISGYNGTFGSSGTIGFNGTGSLVTHCCGSKSKIASPQLFIIDNDICYYCNECGERVLRKDFITFEEWINKLRSKKLKEILDDNK